MAKINTDEGRRISELQPVESLTSSCLVLITLENGTCRNMTIKSFKSALLQQTSAEPDPDNEIYSKSEVDDKITDAENKAAQAANKAEQIEQKVNDSLVSLNNSFSSLKSEINQTLTQEINSYKEYMSTQINNMNQQVNEKMQEIQAQADKFALKSKKQGVTLAHSDWAEDESQEFFTYTLTVNDITEQTNVEVLLDNTVTTEQVEAWDALGLEYGKQTTNQIVLYAYGVKPQADIPITLIIRGDAEESA